VEDVDEERLHELESQQEDGDAAGIPLIYDVDPSVLPADAGAKPTTPITEGDAAQPVAGSGDASMPDSTDMPMQAGKMRVVR
jgi:hypothetical protein